jgi:hypothetical protein
MVVHHVVPGFSLISFLLIIVAACAGRSCVRAGRQPQQQLGFPYLVCLNPVQSFLHMISLGTLVERMPDLIQTS